jgi:hypothetical protein
VPQNSSDIRSTRHFDSRVLVGGIASGSLSKIPLISNLIKAGNGGESLVNLTSVTFHGNRFSPCGVT